MEIMSYGFNFRITSEMNQEIGMEIRDQAKQKTKQRKQ